jgi:hypothetical protein
MKLALNNIYEKPLSLREGLPSNFVLNVVSV